MKRNVLLAAFALLVVVGAAGAKGVGGYLVKIDLNSPDQVFTLADRDIRVLTGLDGSCLALLAGDEFSRLGNDFRCEVLDANPEENVYFLVTSRAGLSDVVPALPGSVLYRSPVVVLLRATEEAVGELNRLPVELCRLSMQPAVMQRDEAMPPVTPLPVSDSLVQQIVNYITEDSVLGTIRRLQDFYTRYSNTDSCRASVNWALNRMTAYNCDTAYGHVYRSSYAPNAVGVKWGQVNPRRIYIVCSHIDNTSNQQPNHCPGADDNGSGTSVVLEACRAFASYDFDYTVKFVAFTGEEQGLFGSDSFSNQAYRRHDTILGVLNFDMISYGRTGYDGIVINGRSNSPNCSSLVNLFCAYADTYTNLTYTKYYYNGGGSGYGSDHYYFWERGYRALWGEENDFTPKYHTIGDTIGPLNYVNCGCNNIPQCTEGVKAAVATIAKLAGVRQLTGVADDRRADAARRPTAGPNPFRDQVAFRFPAGFGSAELAVYDAAGRRLRAWAVRGPGDVPLTWDGRDARGRRVEPGVYFYRAETNGRVMSGRLVRIEN
jgi:hypothetical protein